MNSREIPEDVLQFIARRIGSVPHLETLLLLWENPTTAWSEQDVSARVYVSREQARGVLLDLLHHRLITLVDTSSEHYRYDSRWDEAQLMLKVASTYRRHLAHVAGIIHAKAASEAVQQFARAFKFKKEE